MLAVGAAIGRPRAARQPPRMHRREIRTQLNDRTIAVVGGATGGAIVALLLARAGARVTLFERVATPQAVGAGIGLAENGMAVLESLDLRTAIERSAREVGAARIVDAQGRVLFAQKAGGPRVWMIRRAELQGVLLGAVAAESRIEPRFGWEALSAWPDGRLLVRDAAGDREVQADLIVAADGVHSRLRDCGRFDARVTPPGIAYIRTLLEADVAQEEEAWTAAGLFGSFAVDGGTYVYASAGSARCRGAVEARDLSAFREVWALAYPPARRILATLRSWDDLILNRVIHVRCRRWSDGRLVLLGDAAHAMAPNVGQGANSAAVDAAVLLDELLRAESLETAVQAYEQRRKPAVEKVAAVAARLGALAEWVHPAARWLRDRAVMPIAARIPDGKRAGLLLQEPPDRLRAIGRATPLIASRI